MKQLQRTIPKPFTALSLVASLFVWGLPATTDAAQTIRISVLPTGQQANQGGNTPVISANGRYVAFVSEIPVAPIPPNHSFFGFYIRDLTTGLSKYIPQVYDRFRGDKTEIAITGDGRYLLYKSNLNGRKPILKHDTRTGQTTEVVSSVVGSRESFNISTDGRYVAHRSPKPLIKPWDPLNPLEIFITDLATGKVERLPWGPNSSNPHAFDNIKLEKFKISPDGQYVLLQDFYSDIYAHFHRLFVYDRKAQKTKMLPGKFSSGSYYNHLDDFLPASIANSPDGPLVVYSAIDKLVPSDTDNENDVYTYNLKTGRITLVSVDSTVIPNCLGIYCGSGKPKISPNGRYVTFVSYYPQLDTIALGLFTRDLILGKTVLSNPPAPNVKGNYGYGFDDYDVSNNGIVTFGSRANNYVVGDTNAKSDVFVRLR